MGVKIVNVKSLFGEDADKFLALTKKGYFLDFEKSSVEGRTKVTLVAKKLTTTGNAKQDSIDLDNVELEEPQ